MDMLRRSASNEMFHRSELDSLLKPLPNIHLSLVLCY